MPLRKIRELPKPCNDPDHDPPSYVVLEPGVYKHVCPSCGKTCIITKASNYLSTVYKN